MTKRIYVPMNHLRNQLQMNHLRSSGLPGGSPDESDRVWPERVEIGLSGQFWGKPSPDAGDERMAAGFAKRLVDRPFNATARRELSSADPEQAARLVSGIFQEVFHSPPVAVINAIVNLET